MTTNKAGGESRWKGRILVRQGEEKVEAQSWTTGEPVWMCRRFLREEQVLEM